MTIIEDMLGHAPPKDLESRFKSEINTTLASDVTAVHKIEQALDEISIPTCVASSGSHEKMHTTLGKQIFSIDSKEIYSAPQT
jgi:beta-phosphoglucomutase-like phosphatase (HAD superfamily)